MKLNNEAAIKNALQLTTIAMENGMIKASSNPQETAQNVFLFCETLYTQLSNKTSE